MLKEFINLLVPIVKNMIKPSNIPYYCTYFVTWRCNINCKICSIWKKTAIPEMDTIQIDKVFKKIPSVTVIRITGGEPFLREDLPEIISTINKNTNVQIVMITTNGTFTDRIINFIKTYKRNNVRIKISLTGYKHTHDKITGCIGTFDKVIKTIESLISLRSLYKFYLGINHTISDINSFEDSSKIRKICRKYKLPYLPVIAFDEIPLYSYRNDYFTRNPKFEKYIHLKENDYKYMLEDLLLSADLINHPIERLLKQYYLRGFYNQFVSLQKICQSKCVVLKNHLRLLPNGDVSVCLYNSNILGNLEKDEFNSLWYSARAVELRKIINNCSGCWQQCDIFPNLIYTGDILPYFVKNLFFRFKNNRKNRIFFRNIF